MRKFTNFIKIENFKVDVRCFYRIFGFKNYHLFLKWDNVDFCELMKGNTSLTHKFFNSCKQRLPQICRECPLKPGIYSTNYTAFKTFCPKRNEQPSFFGSEGMWERDGDYQYKIRFYNNRDSEIFFLNYFFR